MHVQSCCFANLNLLFFSRSRCRRRRRCSKNDGDPKNFTSMVTWRHTSATHGYLNGKMQLK